MTATAVLVNPPGPTGSRWGAFLKAVRDPLTFLESMQSQYGDVVMLERNRLYVVAAPDGVEHILQNNHLNYEKGSFYRRALRPLMGNGLLISEGQPWLRQRRVAQIAFSRKRHEYFAGIIVQRLDQLRRGWIAAALEGRPLDLEQEMVRITLAMMFRLLFSDLMEDREAELMEALLLCEADLNLVRVFAPVRLPDWFPTPANRRVQKGLRVLDDFYYGCIRARRQTTGSFEDLLSLYLNARFEDTGEPLDDRAVRDELMTFVMAGHDTTAIALTWMLYLLMRHPREQARLVTELDEALGGRLPTFADLESLPFLGRTVREGLRLYPTAWGLMRRALGDDVICGLRIPAGAGIVISPYLTHRLASVWEDPLRFDPDRFLPERAQGRHRFAWFPFGAGPRLCIGMGFALLEIQLALAVLLQTFEMELLPGPEIGFSARISLRPDRPLMVRLKIRSGGGTARCAPHAYCEE